MARVVAIKAPKDDPYRIHHRLERQIDLLLTEMEAQPQLFSFRDRLAVVEKVGMYLTRNAKLQEAENEPSTGAAISKYTGAFKTSHVARGRATNSRPTITAVADDTDPDDAA